jgi:FkbM family methyltransferase
MQTMIDPAHYNLEYWLQLLNEPIVSPNDPFRAGQEFVIYGAGNRGREALQLLTMRGCKVRGFLDRDGAPEKVLHGIPCVRLEERERLGDLSGVNALIAIFNPALAITPIYEALRTSGFESIFSFYDLDAVFHESIGDFFWLTERRFWYDNLDEIEHLATLLNDEKSRDSLAAILALRLKGDFHFYEEQRLPVEQQYFAPGITDWKLVQKLVDCGAYDGDTIKSALQHCELQEVFAFEPDFTNFRALSKRFQNGEFGKLKGGLFPCGAWSQTTTLRFNAGKDAGSCLDVNGESTIACTSIDEAVINFDPDYIKMDIEGAELEALRGARKTIENHRPLLAICLYHQPQHLWEIPFLIESWNLDYTFFIRSHYFNGFDTLLYAVPK